MCGIDPSKSKGADVGGVDLVEGAEAAAGIVAIVGGLRICSGLEKGRRIKALRGCEGCAQAYGGQQQQVCDSSLLRKVRKHGVSSSLIHGRASLLQACQIGKEIVNIGLRKLREQIAMGGERIQDFDLHAVAREGAIPAGSVTQAD